MRVVDRKTFLTLPAKTIYCKGVRWAFDSICIKGDSLENDWVYVNPAWANAHDSGGAIDLLEKSLEDSSSFDCETDFGRDGCFNDKDVFLIFETADLMTLRNFIDRAITTGAGQGGLKP
ncbi:hypothetical protein [Bradyrhizobium sp. JR18.2]|uniref:hypothetical protein n=1 Tax=Bradyrhizobium sp. JR18.2 TaxID=3156369 RepID=UPI0033994F8A